MMWFMEWIYWLCTKSLCWSYKENESSGKRNKWTYGKGDEGTYGKTDAGTYDKGNEVKRHMVKDMKEVKEDMVNQVKGYI